MVLGNLIQINAKGPEDLYLYGNPQITYFKEVYKRATNFSINYSKIPFTSGGQVNFGSEIRFSIPLKADLLGGLYLKIKFNDLLRTEQFLIGGNTPTYGGDGYFTEYSSYVNGIGFNIIDTIKLYINGQLIQTLDSQLIYHINELHSNHSKKQAFYRMTQFYPSVRNENSNNFKIANFNVTGVNTELLVPFFFSSKSSQYLPLCSLTHSDVQVHIKLKSLEKCVVRRYNSENSNIGVNGTEANGDPRGDVPALNGIYNEEVTGSIASFEAIAEYIYLDDDERKLFLNKELSYLIELYNIGSPDIISNPSSSSTYYMDITAKHPTRYIFWTLQREDVLNANFYDNYTSDFGLKYIEPSNNSYSYFWTDHLISDTTVMLNNTDLSEVDAIFLSEMQLFEKFNTSTNSLVYIYSFALNPKSIEPTGTINLSKILHKTLKITLVDESKYTNNGFKPNLVFRYYSSYYNILSIKNGLAGLVFQ